MTPADVNAMISAVIGIEGGYSNNRADAGGETMWGITAATAAENGYHGAMKDMPRDVAMSIYLAIYWQKPGFDRIALLSSALSRKLFDTGVNCGTAVAATMLQRALNALNRQQADYPDMKVDGAVGGVTVAALQAYLGKRGQEGEMVLLRAINCLQGERYIDLCERNQSQETFLYGWLLNRVGGTI